MSRWRHKRMLVTGAASGIGAELARFFLNEGATVQVCDLDKDKLTALFSRDAGAVIHAFDVRDYASWEGAMEFAREGLDYHFNVAGVIRPSYLTESSAGDIDLQIDVNLKGVIYGTQHAARAMAPRGAGHIVNIGSMAGLAPVSGIPVYSASKFGVRGFSLAMALELEPSGVKVSVVSPDAVGTSMLDEQAGQEAAALVFSGNRILTAADVRKAIVRDVLTGGRTEVWLPMERGIQAYLGATFPGLASLLYGPLKRRGLKRMASYRKGDR